MLVYKFRWIIYLNKAGDYMLKKSNNMDNVDINIHIFKI